METASLPKEHRLGWPFALACAPLIGALLLVFLMRPGGAALGAVLLGPWAGLPYGHRSCTIGTVAPEVSFVCLGLLVPVLALAVLRRRPLRDPLTLLAFGLWSTLWAAGAVFSVLNTLE